MSDAFHVTAWTLPMSQVSPPFGVATATVGAVASVIEKAAFETAKAERIANLEKVIKTTKSRKTRKAAEAALENVRGSEMGMVNKVVPLDQLEAETVEWCREMLSMSPIALRFLKASFNADCDGQMGLLDLAGNATLLYYMSEEGREGKEAFLEKRQPDFSKFPRVP